MTLQQLEYFLAALDHGSFSQAADALHMAQPSLSEQVRRLEAELGVALFVRGGRGLRPTEAGRALRDHAERVLHEVDGVREAVADVREVRGGVVTFGILGAARFYPASQIVADFRRSYPGVRVRLAGLNSAEVADAIREGDLEAGMVALPIDDRGLDVRPVMRDELVYASADASRLQAPKTIAELASVPLVMYDASYGLDDPSRRQFNALAQEAGVQLVPEIDVEDMETAFDLVADGFGDMWASRGVLLSLGRRVPDTLGWVPFADPVYDWFAFISRRGARVSPASREFLRIAEHRLLEVGRALESRPPRQRLPAAPRG